MRARSLALSLLAGLIAACTPTGETPEERITPQPTKAEARLARILCQLSAGSFDDPMPARRDIMLPIPGLQGPPVTEKTVIGPFKVGITFVHDGDGAPHLSFAVGRAGEDGYDLHGEMFELATDEDGGVILPDNQLGSGFTGTAYIRYPDREKTLTRYCRAF